MRKKNINIKNKILIWNFSFYEPMKLELEPLETRTQTKRNLKFFLKKPEFWCEKPDLDVTWNRD